jgi:DNA end-binding protein Ku
MASRTSWKGFLKLSLVSVPVKAYTANNADEEIRLNQLHSECHARVRYKKVCPEHGELKSDDIVSGYEHAKDSYVVVDDEELGKLRTKSDRAVHIDGFVDPAAIDARFHAGRTYYLVPDGTAGNRPYALLCQGMREANVVAIAQVVLTGREQLVMVRPEDGMLVMSLLHYPKRVKEATPFKDELPKEELSKEELKLTNTLIGASVLQDFDLQSYKDAYVENLGKLIQLKIQGQEIVQAPDLEEPKILNLMEALKRSVAEAGARKMAPSVKAAKEAAAEESEKRKPARKRKTG